MPKVLDHTVKQIMKEGKSKNVAYAIAVSALQKGGYLKKSSLELTKKGREWRPKKKKKKGGK